MSHRALLKKDITCCLYTQLCIKRLYGSKTQINIYVTWYDYLITANTKINDLELFCYIFIF